MRALPIYASALALVAACAPVRNKTNYERWDEHSELMAAQSDTEAPEESSEPREAAKEMMKKVPDAPPPSAAAAPQAGTPAIQTSTASASEPEEEPIY